MVKIISLGTRHIWKIVYLSQILLIISFYRIFFYLKPASPNDLLTLWMTTCPFCPRRGWISLLWDEITQKLTNFYLFYIVHVCVSSMSTCQWASNFTWIVLKIGTNSHVLHETVPTVPMIQQNYSFKKVFAVCFISKIHTDN